jgi:rSAM/selenodomain-associated transferase 1
VPGEVKTRLTPPLDPDEACRLYAAFLEDMAQLAVELPDLSPTLFLVRNANQAACGRLLPDWQHSWQVEGDLGRRLEAALNELHEAGDRAVIVGSDHPDLPNSLVRAAYDALAETDLVLGPTPDGGYYLIGTRQAHRDLFEEIEWSSPHTAEQTEQRARQRGLGVARLETWADVDSWQDVVDLVARLETAKGSAPATRRLLQPLIQKYGSG